MKGGGEKGEGGEGMKKNNRRVNVAKVHYRYEGMSS
jgi:hypothetical protein